MNENKCPTCGCESYVVIGVSSSDGYVSLDCYHCGGVRLNACTECGTVYLKKQYLEEIKGAEKKKLEREKERAKSMLAQYISEHHTNERSYEFDFEKFEEGKCDV